MTRILLLAAVLLAACAPVREAPAPARAAAGPQVVVLLSQTGQPARTLLEQVAASCWLDGVVGGAQLIVDRQTGRVIIVSDTSDLLTADFIGIKDGRSRLRMAGPVVGDPGKQRRLVETLDIASRTGKTDCPRIVG